MDEKDRKDSEHPEEEERAKTSPDQEERGEPSLSEVDKLRQALEAKELEAKENYDRFLRQSAELENFKKRMVREREETVRYGNESLIRDLLPILDNLERAVEHALG
ncbi:MAG: nucleotide exchange factor GrpE, partial [Deltaproteobacteria bacterium]|nr:nucleotide exchange factor GrpE [Deltaproteobacteria bacterium]